jgi:hypothetical protein
MSKLRVFSAQHECDSRRLHQSLFPQKQPLHWAELTLCFCVRIREAVFIFFSTSIQARKILLDQQR